MVASRCGRAMLEAIQSALFTDLRGILVSRDAQAFYAKFGFEKSDRDIVKPALSSKARLSASK